MKEHRKLLVILMFLASVSIMCLAISCYPNSPKTQTHTLGFNSPKIPLTSWVLAKKYVEDGKSVQLIVNDIIEVKDGVQVLFVDRGKEYTVGWAYFFPVNVGKSSFIFDLGQTLSKVDGIPDNDAHIVTRDKRGNVVKFGKIQINLLDN